MNRKCEQSVTTDERRTFTKVLGADKDKVHRDQTVGNDNKDAMLDCKSGFHPSEDKLKRNNCLIYVTSIMIITFLMFLLKQSTLSAVIFLFVPLGLSLFCVYIVFSCCTGMLVWYQVTWCQMNVMYWTKQRFVYNKSVTNQRCVYNKLMLQRK